MNISLSAFAHENLVSRDGLGSPVPRQPAHLYTQAESGAYLRDPSRVLRRRPFIYLECNALVVRVSVRYNGNYNNTTLCYYCESASQFWISGVRQFAQP